MQIPKVSNVRVVNVGFTGVKIISMWLVGWLGRRKSFDDCFSDKWCGSSSLA